MISNLKNKLLKREREGNLRELRAMPSLIDFSSNDYLGLARSSTLKELVAQEMSQCKAPLNGLGSTGSRLLTGHSYYAQELENQIAKFHGFETGLLFNSGYTANLGLLSTIAGVDDCIFFDTGVHASTRDGMTLSRGRAYPFKHNDPVHLENRLKNCVLKGERFICIESIYSTDGSKAPLVEICQLAKEYDAYLIVDEAHAVGVCGHQGRGLVAEHNLSSYVFAQITTFSKALGVHGAIILGSRALKQMLINFAHAFIYTTAPPMYSLGAIRCSYSLFPEMDRERKQLQSLSQLYQQYHPNASKTHIQSFHVQGNEAVTRYAKKITERGFDVRPLMSPTVQKGKEVLRICLHAFNTEKELYSLIELLKENAK